MCHGIRSGQRAQLLGYKYRCGWIGDRRQVEEIHPCPVSFLDYICSYHQAETITNWWCWRLSSYCGVWPWAERSWKKSMFLPLSFNFSSAKIHIRNVLFLCSAVKFDGNFTLWSTLPYMYSVLTWLKMTLHTFCNIWFWILRKQRAQILILIHCT